MPQTLTDLLADINMELALGRITREQAITRITSQFAITEVGAADLLDNGIQTGDSRHESMCRALDAGQPEAARKFPRRR